MLCAQAGARASLGVPSSLDDAQAGGGSAAGGPASSSAAAGSAAGGGQALPAGGAAGSLLLLGLSAAPPAFQSKNVHALRTLFNVAQRLADVLGPSWVLVVQVLFVLDRALPAGSGGMVSGGSVVRCTQLLLVSASWRACQ